MKYRLFVMTWLMTVLLAATAAAQQTDLRKTIETMLGGFEETATDAQWQALGEDAVKHLVVIGKDDSRLVSQRARAVSALGNFNTEMSVTYLAIVLEHDEPAALQRNALRALARTGGGAKVTLIGGFLGHEDSALREAAAHALGLIATDEARALMEARRAIETSTAVRRALDEELAR